MWSFLGSTTGVLAASVIIAFLGVFGFLVVPAMHEPTADMHIEPTSETVGLGKTFTVQLVVSSKVPVNVFAGELHFNNDILAVDSIDYNTSIADLWAEKPWYSNGAGTLSFGGGTTKEGGFTGDGTLITVTFETVGKGQGVISIHDPRILLHDGLGTDATVGTPLDAVFTVEDVGGSENNLVSQSGAGTSYKVVETPPTTDLNGDGKHTVADVSIFMRHLLGNDPAYDFNGDGSVNMGDLSILLQKVAAE